MTEPGADQRARGAMEDDARIVIAPISHSVPAYGRVACTRAELWAAIEAMLEAKQAMIECTTLQTILDYRRKRSQVRALLGLEPEA